MTILNDPDLAADLADLASRDPVAARLIRALANSRPETGAERGERMAEEAMTASARAAESAAYDRAHAPALRPQDDDPSTAEDRMAQFEAEVLIQQPAMVEGIAIVLACAFAGAETAARIREDAVTMLTLPMHMDGEIVQQHIHAGRVAAVDALARVADLLEGGERLRRMSAGTETPQ